MKAEITQSDEIPDRNLLKKGVRQKKCKKTYQDADLCKKAQGRDRGGYRGRNETPSR